MMKAYPEYKESGVEWLGDVPAHWNLKKVAWDMPFVVGWTPSTKETKYFEGENTWVSIEDMKSKIIECSKKQISDLAISDKGISVVPKNSLLFSFKLSVGKVGFSAKELYTNEAIASFLENDSVHLPFLYYAAPLFLPRFGQENIYGALLMNQERILSAKTYMPCLEEQKVIAVYLDANIARIDNLIAEKESFIKLLSEKRQALISHVVTKGLNPNVPMKDSGVEWIGKIPESWSVSPIRYLVEYASTGGTPKNQESFSDNGDINWFAPGDFKGDLSLCSSKKKITRDSISTGDAKLYPKNSVIVIGIGATLGKVAYSEQEFSCNQQINILVPNKKVNYQYLAYAMSVQMEQMKLLSNASTIGIMNQEKTKSIVLALPNVDEQKSIISFLDNKLDKIKAIEKETNNSIELLKEHRTALISAAVTGKIDVREEV